jgi:hypothetical protein
MVENTCENVSLDGISMELDPKTLY